MLLKILCFAVVLFHITSSTKAQSAENIFLDVGYKSTTLKSILKDLQKKSGLIFVYANENVDQYKNVSVKSGKRRLSEILNEAILNTNLRYRQAGRKILFIPVAQKVESEKKPDPAPADTVRRRVSGKVTDADGVPLQGVTVRLKNAGLITTTNKDGEYTIPMDDPADVLVFTHVGVKTQEIGVRGSQPVYVKMVEDTKDLIDVVVVGYAKQSKQSVVGAIATLSAETLEKRGGVSNLASALSGQIPGVVVMETTGEPGRDDPSILIRGQSTWNGAQPLILVDGIERKMNDISVSEIETISVLKDASATAVFGVKGANGVILVTTKRGKSGKAQLTFSGNTAVKTISRIPKKLDAYEAKLWKNAAVENEVSVNEAAWQYYVPYEEVLRSKLPQVEPYTYLYPNVDWYDVMTKDFALNQRVNMNISGGTDFAKYFASVGYLAEGDIINSNYNSERNYDPGYGYQRFNFRANLDFLITKTTTFSTNISGFMGNQKRTAANFGGENDFTSGHIYRAFYELAPDAFPIMYPDGLYGKDPTNQNMHNPVSLIQNGGVLKTNRKHIGANFLLDQKLNFITKGLVFNASVSFDNYSITNGANIQDGSNQGQTLYEYISPAILNAKNYQDSLNAINIFPSQGVVAVNEFDFVIRPWTVTPEHMVNGGLERAIFYQAGFNYNRKFGIHDVTALFLFNRRKNAIGAVFPSYREDWVGRVTYNYSNRYFFEVNGAYNGSEKFSPEYRFGFFPSVALGWMVTEEKFMQSIHWLDRLKIRGSAGKVGSDNGIPRWGYLSSWASGGTSYFNNVDGLPLQPSPYVSYREGVIANEMITWETALKKNIGFELSVLKRLTVTTDLFHDRRENIFLSGNQRNIPAYFGAAPVPVNMGITTNQGYEIEAGYKGGHPSAWYYNVQLSFTKAKDKIIQSEDPLLKPAYQKLAGFQIGQTRTSLSSGYINNWDDLYASAPLSTGMNFRLPGDWDIVDYNADGVINNFDAVPYGFPTRPSKTWSANLSGGYKGLSVMVQFYAVTDISLRSPYITPAAQRWTAVSEDVSDYWTPDNTDAFYKAPRLTTTSPTAQFGIYDGSYMRLKTAEIAYRLPQHWLKWIGVSNTRIYLNGNNLVFWSKLPMDRETGAFDIQNAYPMFKTFNFGIDVSF